MLQQEKNSAVFEYWQHGFGSDLETLYAELLALVTEKPIFNQLRTAEQLGYIVWSGADTRANVQGFKIHVEVRRAG